MSDDVIIGYDGKPRCVWTGAGDTPSVRYHDEVWGTRTYDESAVLEALATGSGGPPDLDTPGREVRQAAEDTGIPLRGAHERLRVHAERRRGQRPHSWLLPSHGLHPVANHLGRTQQWISGLRSSTAR